jgi:hypothetical protein
LIPALSVPCLCSLLYFLWFRDSFWTRIAYAGAKGFTVVWPVVAIALVLRRKLPPLDLSRIGWRTVLTGAVSGFALVLIFALALQTPLWAVLQQGAPAIRAKTEAFGVFRHYWWFALALSFVHSLIEEYYWRWFVYGHLREVVSRVMAHGLAGVGFASHHVVIAGHYFGWGWGCVFGAGVALGGIFWSVLYQRQGTLAGAWVSHIVVDLGIFAVGHRLLYGSYF